jgi:hypothetical protein
MSDDFSALQLLRRQRWHQTPELKIAESDAAIPLLEKWGIATLYAVSPEIPSLYAAHMGEPEPPTFAEWDSPSGRVYGWRWELGKRKAGFYANIVKKRPTFIAWNLLPAVIRLYEGFLAPKDLYQAGALSEEAFRIAEALEAAGTALSTGELRSRAGFPKGKERRAAFLKAIEEMDARLLLSKVFDAEGGDMSHALVRSEWPEALADAERLTPEAAMDRLARTYLRSAVYAAPAALAKPLRLPESALRGSFERMAANGEAVAVDLPGYKGVCYSLADMSSA